MKKLLFVLALLFVVFSKAQEVEVDVLPQDQDKHHEVNFNALNLIAFKWFDVSYEYLLNEESSFGISAQMALDPEVYGFDSNKRKYAITPYYRHFFSKKYARGFFVEAFGSLNGGIYEEWIYEYIEDCNGEYGCYHEYYKEYKYDDLAFGVGVGGKFVSKLGFVGEIHAGIARNLFENYAPEVIGRLGVSLGYRF